MEQKKRKEQSEVVLQYSIEEAEKRRQINEKRKHEEQREKRQAEEKERQQAIKAGT